MKTETGGVMQARLACVSPTLSLFAVHTTCFKPDWTVAGRHLFQGGAETTELLKGAWECGSVFKSSLDNGLLSGFRQVNFLKYSFFLIWKMEFSFLSGKWFDVVSQGSL